MKRAVPILILLLLLAGGALRAEPVPGRQMQAQVYFPIGKSVVDPSFRDNGATLDAFVRSLQAVLADPNYVISHLSVYGTASPDGREEVIAALDGDKTRKVPGQMMMPELLQNTESVRMTDSGMAFYYELGPAVYDI